MDPHKCRDIVRLPVLGQCCSKVRATTVSDRLRCLASRSQTQTTSLQWFFPARLSEVHLSEPVHEREKWKRTRQSVARSKMLRKSRPLASSNSTFHSSFASCVSHECWTWSNSLSVLGHGRSQQECLRIQLRSRCGEVRHGEGEDTVGEEVPLQRKAGE